MKLSRLVPFFFTYTIFPLLPFIKSWPLFLCSGMGVICLLQKYIFRMPASPLEKGLDIEHGGDEFTASLLLFCLCTQNWYFLLGPPSRGQWRPSVALTAHFTGRFRRSLFFLFPYT